MLTLTDNAVQVIRDLSSSSLDAPDTTRIRISSQADGEGSLVLSVTEAPESTDQLIQAEGVQVYLDQQAAAILDDKSLDAAVNEQGGVAFLISEQRSGGHDDIEM
ncbi:Fe-S cluster assembly protein HesB [Rhizohabitans arisaemae]|uniref:Fe-S cluster assembly protein HesB n=1 Tax=Rhizohabitans arisaemae TaxID=2720610 RepID=UPI0024B1F8F2|nr:Fe-S cluster assembly protein HesB [Rhizohabitans arisaemae]